VAWVRALEVDRFGLPVPDRQLLLDVPRAVAAERAAHRERTEAGRGRDRYESDSGLQERTAAAYAQLAAVSWLSPWTVLDGTGAVDLDALAAQLLG
jgi:dTMP kinase